jgi:hypothetical protein
MGVEQTAFYSKELSDTGVVVGGIFAKPKTPNLKTVKKSSDRRVQQPLGKNVVNQTVTEKPNPLTFGLLGLDF